MCTIENKNKIVAVKRIFHYQQHKNRESIIMKELNHVNVVKFIHTYFTKDDEDKKDSR